MNGRQARSLRQVDDFDASDGGGWQEIREQLFGDRFKAGYGHNDPAYMPLYPHENAEYLYTAGRVMWDRNHSCAELELWIEKAPGWEQLGRDDHTERWYDDSCRLAAKWILSRLRGVPEDARLVATFWQEMEGSYPHLVTMNMSTAQKVWVRAAALRIFDADRYDAKIRRPR